MTHCAVSLLLDGQSAAVEARWAGLSDKGGSVYWLGGLKWSIRMLLFWVPNRTWPLRAEGIQPGEPLSFAACQHWLRCQHTGCILQRQLQACHWNQVGHGFIILHSFPNTFNKIKNGFYCKAMVIFSQSPLQSWWWYISRAVLLVDWMLHLWGGIGNGHWRGKYTRR